MLFEVILAEKMMQLNMSSELKVPKSKWLDIWKWNRYYWKKYKTQWFQYTQTHNIRYPNWFDPISVDISGSKFSKSKVKEIHSVLMIVIARCVHKHQFVSCIEQICASMGNNFIYYHLSNVQKTNDETQIAEAMKKAEKMRKTLGIVKCRCLTTVDIQTGTSLPITLHKNDFICAKERFQHDENIASLGFFKIVGIVQFEGLEHYLSLHSMVQDEIFIYCIRWIPTDPDAFQQTQIAWQNVPNLAYVKSGEFAKFIPDICEETNEPIRTVIYTSDCLYQAIPVSICKRLNQQQSENFHNTSKHEHAKTQIYYYGIYNVSDKSTRGCFIAPKCPNKHCTKFPCEDHMYDHPTQHPTQFDFVHTCDYNTESCVYLVSCWQGLILSYLKSNSTINGMLDMIERAQRKQNEQTSDI